MRNTRTYNSKNIYCICFLLMLCILSGVQAQKEMKEGNKLLKKGSYHKALLSYKKVEKKMAEQEPDIQADFFSKIGECYLGLGYYSLAYSYFEEATKYDSTYVSMLDSYIETLKNNGKYQKALELYYQKLLAENPSLNDSPDNKSRLAHYTFPYQNLGENKLVTIIPQNSINTLGRKRGLSIINNKLYYSTTGYSIIPDQKDYPEKITKYTIFSGDIVENNITNSIVENDLLDIESNITYICIHPKTNNLFFTVITSDNEEYLYEAKTKEDGKWEGASKVKIGKKIIPVSHPVFSTDGTIMIFSSNIPNGMGGYDIWYTKQTEKGWSEPHNLSNVINTNGDEICPFLYNGSLFFSSNGQAENYGGFDIYCANITDNNNVEVENILLPYNSYADDIEFTIDAQHSKGFLVSTRDYTSTDDKIYSFSEVPYYTIVKGNVSDYYNNTLPEATITVIENNTPIYTAKTDETGNYQVYLKNNHQYTLEISKANYLSTKNNYTTQTSKLIGNTEIKTSTKLDGFELNKAYKIDNLFFHTASYEFATIGKTLPKIETFMKENPHLDLYFYLFGYLTTDDKFNNLLNQRRINSITNYFIEQSVNENRIKYRKYSNEIPTNFGKVDLKKDTSYLLYFLFVPKDTDAIKANTTSR